MDGWNTIVSFWGPAYFQVQAVSFRGCRCVFCLEDGLELINPQNWGKRSKIDEYVENMNSKREFRFSWDLFWVMLLNNV